MNCREVTEFLMDYLDGRLAGDELALFREHLGECPECVAYLDGYRTAVELSGAAFAAEPAADAPEDLVRAILAARPAGH